MYAEDCIDPERDMICGYCLEIHDPNPPLSNSSRQVIIDVLEATEVCSIPEGIYIQTAENPNWQKVSPVRLFKVFFLGE